MADAEIASATCIYGPTGGYAGAQINTPYLPIITPNLPVQFYLGQSALVGAVCNGNNKWNIYEVGLDATLFRAGGIAKIDIGIFHCEIQVGVSVGMGGSFTVGGYNDNSGFGVVLGAAASWFFGAEVTGKVWIDF